MAKRPEVLCRICGMRFQRDDGIENVDWVNPRKNQFYHKSCYDTWVDTMIKNVKDPKVTVDNETYLKYIYELYVRDLKIPVDYVKMRSQFENFLKKKGYTAKGICFAVRYFYLIKKGDTSKAEGGIGIVPYVYEDSKQYWIEQERKKAGTIAEILKQMEERSKRSKIVVKKVEPARKKYVSHLDEIGDMDD